MLKRTLAVPLFLIALAVVLSGCSQANREAPLARSDQREAILSYVESVTALVEQQGEACFPALRKKGGPWYRGDRYAFVWRLDGTRVVYPPDPRGENKNVANLKDAHGKPIGKWFLDVARSKDGEGWVYYEWPRPGGVFPVLKLSYIQAAEAPSGKRYLVGSGEYMEEPDLLLVKSIVDDAVRLLATQGKKAFPALRDPAGRHVFGDAYIFAYDTNCVCLFNYATPSIEGKDLSSYKDPKGFLLIPNFLKATKDGHTAFVSYFWPKPGQSDLSRKIACVRRVQTPDGEMLVGSGVYSR